MGRQVCERLSLLFVAALVASQARADPNVMYCLSWSAPGMCIEDTANAGVVGCNEVGIGAMQGASLYEHGVFSVGIKFMKGNTQGTVTAFYLIDTVSKSNKDKDHFEIDIEFYGQPNSTDTVMATNVFFSGRQNLAQFKLPFDPTEAYHTYTMQWNANAIIWLVDNLPVRVIRKLATEPWPATPLQPMFTVWPINWGTQADFSAGPIVSHVRNFQYAGCTFSNITTPTSPIPLCTTRTGFQYPWNALLTPPQAAVLSPTPDGYVANSTVINAWSWDDA